MKKDGKKCKEGEKRGKKKRKRRRSEFGEMVITSAFQADFVGSSPITRKERRKEGFQGSNRTRKERNGVEHCDKPVQGG